VAAVFQDFARFPATLRENIGFGDLGALDNEDAVRDVASTCGLTSLIAALPGGLDTPLSKQLEDGVELSGGQWQRVAIARALMRSAARLVILDEPTAALDPQTEFEALGVFRAMAQRKMAVIIGHRLALARIASKIIVMERGEILEQGTHDELMRAGGRYAAMFTRQASSYLDVEHSALSN
jgi:ATP-binding cassette subfamily B protein